MQKKDYLIIKRGSEARKALKRGIDEVVDTVKTTLGGKGRNSIFEMKNKPPRVTNDGVSIAKEIILEDEIENLGAQAIIDAAIKTNDMVGDGTTTTMVIAQALIDSVFKELAEGSMLSDSADLMGKRREIFDTCDKAIEKLEKKAKKIEKIEDIEKVATSSVEDEKWGKIVAEMVEKVGKDGFVSVDDSYFYETETEVVNGMRFLARPAADFMTTNEEKKEAVFDDVLVVVTNHEIETPGQLTPLAKLVQKDNRKKMVVIAPKFQKGVLATMYNTSVKAGFDILAIKAPSLTTDEWNDLAVYLGAEFIDSKKGMKLENSELDEMGWCEKIVSNEEETVIIGGGGAESEVKERIKYLKGQIKIEEDKRFKKKLERRIASLTGGVGIIKVGASSDIEKHYLRLKIEDAVQSTKIAMADGIVKGGGVALKEIADEMGDNILTKALNAPYEQIQQNAGGKLKIGSNIVDPVKVVSTALKNACSVAGTLITTESAMAPKRDYNREALKRLLNG